VVLTSSVEIRRGRISAIIKICVLSHSRNGADLRTPYFGIKTVDKRQNAVGLSQALE